MPKKRRSAAGGSRAGASTPPRSARVAPSRAETSEPQTAAATRATAVMWIALALLVLARAALAFVPSMAAWGLNLQRFLPGWTWALWALGALALIPAFGRRLEPWLTGAGRAIERSPGFATFVAIVVAVVLVSLFPDRVRFVGDFLIRQGTVQEAVKPSLIYPQALPLDVLLHYTIPRLTTDLGLADANGAARWIGAIDAALLAGLAIAFVRALALRGAQAAACAGVVWFGGYVGLYTGFGKAFAEECVVAAALGTFGVQVVRTGRGLWPFGIALALGITLHRSALAFVPAALLVWALWFFLHGRGAKTRTSSLLAVALPVVTLAIMLPRIIQIVRRFDSVHFRPYTVVHEGPIAAAFAGARPWDMLGLVTMLSPLAIATPFVLAWLGGASIKRRELWVLAALALPLLVAMPFIHPAQGMFRDWDDFAALAVTLSLVTAWTLGEALRGASSRAWLAAAVMLGAAVPTTGWLVHHADVERGLARVTAFMNEPPARTDDERATTFDYLGSRNENLGHYEAAADAFAHAAQYAPSPRLLLLWGILASRAGRVDEAQTAFRSLVVKDSTSVPGWMGLAAASFRLHQYAEARHAAERVLVLDPQNPQPREVLAAIDRMTGGRDSTR
jgi:hypothetical protein